MKHFLSTSPRRLESTGPRQLETTATRVFSLPPAEQPTPENLVSAHIARRIVSKRTVRDFREITAAAKLIDRLPERDESVHALMRGDFNGWDLVPAVLRLAAPATIAELCVATLGFNFKNAAELLELLDRGDVGSVLFVCSCYFEKSCPKEYAALRDGLQERGQAVVAIRSHAKILAMQLTDGRCIVVETSANLRSCRNIEQLAMTESPALYDFHREWIAEVSCRKRNLPQPHPQP